MHPKGFQKKPSVVLRPCATVTTVADWWTEPKRMEQIVLSTLFVTSASPKIFTLFSPKDLSNHVKFVQLQSHAK